MLKLEDIKPGMRVRGLVPGHDATIVSADFIDEDALNIFYTMDQGHVAWQICRDNTVERSVIVTPPGCSSCQANGSSSPQRLCTSNWAPSTIRLLL